MEEQVFNADETGLFYKDVGKRTYITQMASKASGFKSFQDYATLLLCTNAKGDFNCKPLMVYRAPSSQAFKGKSVNHMPVHWRWNKKAWMTSDWFQSCFIPEVEYYLQDRNLAFKILLILDNVPVHCCEELTNAHPNVEVLFLPPNATSLIQPLDQGIIKAFKAHYTRELYSKAFEALKANKESTVMDYWKSVTIHNVIDYVGTAWDNIKRAAINNCWKNVWLDCVENFEGFEGVTESIKNSVKNIMPIAWQISGEGFDDMREEDVGEIKNPPMKTWTRWQNKALESMITKTAMKVSLRVQELSLLQRPKYQNGTLPWENYSMTWKCVTLCSIAASTLSA